MDFPTLNGERTTKTGGKVEAEEPQAGRKKGKEQKDRKEIERTWT